MSSILRSLSSRGEHLYLHRYPWSAGICPGPYHGRDARPTNRWFLVRYKTRKCRTGKSYRVTPGSRSAFSELYHILPSGSSPPPTRIHLQFILGKLFGRRSFKILECPLCSRQLLTDLSFQGHLPLHSRHSEPISPITGLLPVITVKV